MKKFLTAVFSLILTVGACFGFVGCEDVDAKYKVTKEEYEIAITTSLQNVTIAMTGPYWERDHIKSYFYSVGKNYAFCSFSGDTLYYGRHYGFANREEFAYVYGNEKFEDFTEDQAVWTKDDYLFYYRTMDINNVFTHRKEFYHSEFNSKTKSYDHVFTGRGVKVTYSYYFIDKKLVKFILTKESNDYKYVYDFYDYGTTKIPKEIDKSTPEDPFLSLMCIVTQVPYIKGEEVYQKHFKNNKYYVFNDYEELLSFCKDVFSGDNATYPAGVPYIEEDLEDSVIFCYYYSVSGSLNFMGGSYEYYYSTNEIVRRNTYKPSDDANYSDVILAYCIDFVKVPKDIFDGLNKT